MEKIIKKKLLLIVSMLAVTFALAGCSSSDKKVEFDYDGNTLVQIAETQATNASDGLEVESVSSGKIRCPRTSRRCVFVPYGVQGSSVRRSSPSMI